MDFSNVIDILTEEKTEVIKEMKQMRKKRKKSKFFDSFLRKISGDVTFGEDISYSERLIEQFDEAIRILKLSSEDETKT